MEIGNWCDAGAWMMTFEDTGSLLPPVEGPLTTRSPAAMSGVLITFSMP
jgi:hypothetical protein